MTTRNFIKRLLLSPVATFAGQRNTGKVALTFDDGPHPEFTAPVSKALRDAGARATFFLVGEQIRRYPHLVQQLREDGHEIASHSMTHPEMKDLHKSKLPGEVDAMFNLRLPDGSHAIQNRYFRPPKGVVTLSLIFYCISHRIKLVFWNQDPEDYCAQSAASILRYFDINPPRAGDIVLFHDKTPHTAEAVSHLLLTLRQLELSPVTISELLA